jgi:pantoate kinase
MTVKVQAYSPAGISSFFEICDRTEDGQPIADVTRVGARGGGFGVQKGMHTEVTVAEAAASSVTVYINGQHAPQAETTRTVVQKLLAKASGAYTVKVKHKVEVPVGAGFGTSAAGALTTALALAKALGLRLTYDAVGKVAHEAEVQCRTGLGTVAPLMLGGCVLTVEPGAPGVARVDRIPVLPDYMVVAGVVESTPTRTVLSSEQRRRAVNAWGRKTLSRILDEPTVENLLESSLDFAEKAGFMTDRTRRLTKVALNAGAVGAAQNMVGEAVHAVVHEKKAACVAEAFKQVQPKSIVIVSKIESQGARLVKLEKV